MGDKYAVRNIRLCTKDCLCLYVCPTGATDTENSIIDVDKCIGCGDCADACPSGAISMVPKEYPKQQDKTDSAVNALKALMRSKSKQENIAAGLSGKLAYAIEKSNRIMAEDIIREAGYMLPQSENTKEFLQSLLDKDYPERFPKDAVKKLLESLNKNEEDKTMNSNKTQENLMAAFAGESQANRKYLAYAAKAEKDGKKNAAKLFKAAAQAETYHALKEYELAGKVGTTEENIKDGIAGETYEFTEMYPEFIKDAEAEGNKAAVRAFTFAKEAEEVHAKLYKDALENIDETEEVFYYLCPVCGNIEKSRPDKCSICGVPGDKFIKF
ncbi:ferritin family protein [Paratissierella segnis]|jgi:rubrerythrin/Fe-S-cluster-containing hydrogenase component 2|nr:ferritin family protein [Paratissierella segnis]